MDSVKVSATRAHNLIDRDAVLLEKSKVETSTTRVVDTSFFAYREFKYSGKTVRLGFNRGNEFLHYRKSLWMSVAIGPRDRRTTDRGPWKTASCRFQAFQARLLEFAAT